MWEAFEGGNPKELGRQSYDVFQSMLMMACLSEPAAEAKGYQYGDPSAVLSAMEQSPRVKMAYNSFMLCKHTPIRDLLAVAGESWVMAEKMSTSIYHWIIAAVVVVVAVVLLWVVAPWAIRRIRGRVLRRQQRLSERQGEGYGAKSEVHV